MVGGRGRVSSERKRRVLGLVVPIPLDCFVACVEPADQKEMEMIHSSLRRFGEHVGCERRRYILLNTTG